MLNSIQIRKQFLTDICIERILPERSPPPPPRPAVNGEQQPENGEGMGPETVFEREIQSTTARVGVVRVVLPPVNGNVREDLWNDA
jgi:hypothetical protein